MKVWSPCLWVIDHPASFLLWKTPLLVEEGVGRAEKVKNKWADYF